MQRFIRRVVLGPYFAAARLLSVMFTREAPTREIRIDDLLDCTREYSPPLDDPPGPPYVPVLVVEPTTGVSVDNEDKEI